ncbi:MAG TPA: hypothetical protein VFA15_00090 [Nitrososphaera sp.]|nr:hypothetical protein [Nitrososphaera sp.]
MAKFNGWCCKNLGFGCNAKEIGATRGKDAPRPKGGSLMTVNIKSHAISTLWKDCACWSPVPTKGGSLAVVTDAGIWNVPLDRPEDRQLVFVANDVLELLGTEFSTDGSLLFLRSSKKDGCEFAPWRVHFNTSAVVLADLGGDLACGKDLDFQALTKPAQVVKETKLIESRVYTSFHRGKYEIILSAHDSLKPLFTKGSDDVDRFDPVWTSSSLIAFVASR